MGVLLKPWAFPQTDMTVQRGLPIKADHIGQMRESCVVMAPVQQLVGLQFCKLENVSCDGVACDDLLGTYATAGRRPCNPAAINACCCDFGTCNAQATC